MSASADQLDSARKRFVVGFGTDERGQKRVVNIDQVFRSKDRDELVRKHLPVASENDETACVFTDQPDLLLLRLPPVFFCDRHEEVEDTVKVRDTCLDGWK